MVANIKIFRFYDGGIETFYAGKTEADCIGEYKAETGLDDEFITHDISISEMTEDELRKYTVTCEETNKTQTFLENLDELIAGGYEFPTYFAGDED